MRHVLAVLAGVIAFAGAKAQAEIPLGVLYPIAGTGAVYGVPAMFGHDLAVDEINAAGGVLGQPLATFKRDTKLKPAAAAAKELVTKDGRRVSAAPPMGSVQVERIRSPLCRSIVPRLLGPPTPAAALAFSLSRQACSQSGHDPLSCDQFHDHVRSS